MSNFYVINASNSINQANHVILGALHLTTGDNAIILSGGSVIAQESGTTGIYLDGSTNGSTLTIDGLVYSSEIGVYALGQNNTINVHGQVYGGISASGQGNAINIADGGYVSGGVTIGGLFSSLNNDGTIDGPNGDGVQMYNTFVTNTGKITGGIFNDGNASGGITNSGTILGGLYSHPDDTVAGTLSINNSGFWDGSLSLPGGDDNVTNVGTITGGVSLGTGNDIFDGTHGHVFGGISGGDGNDSLTGGMDDDMLDGGAGGDFLNGGGGNNTLSYGSSLKGVYVDVGNNIAKHGDAAGDVISHIQNVTGSTKADTLVGDGNDNTLNGVLGNDTIYGNGGDDTMEMLGKGKVHLDGGAGNDTFILASAAPAVYGAAFSNSTHIDGGTGFDTVLLSGAATVGFDSTTLVNVERIQMLDGFNFKFTTVDATVAAGETLQVDGTALGSAYHLTVYGGAETDGAFVLDGGNGLDILVAGAGNDTLNGGGERDALTGGAGSDTFVYDDITDSSGSKYDTITDFDANADHIAVFKDVTGVDAAVTGVALNTSGFGNGMTAALNGKLVVDHAVLVTASSGTLSGHTFLVIDADGHAGYHAGDDLVIDVTGVTGTLTTGDFI